jgi:hypothetical protein
MPRFVELLTMGMLSIGLVPACGQTDVAVAQAQDSSGAIPSAQASVSSPSLSGVDYAGVESQTPGKWFLSPQVYGLEMVGTDVGGATGSAPVGSITRAYAALITNRKWKHYDLGLGYIGGVSVYSANGEARQAQAGVLQQGFNWNSGQLQMMDVFSYLPEGGFGWIPFGGLGLFQAAMGSYLSLVTSARFGLLSPSQFASFGNSSRRTNVALVEADQHITARSSITAVAAYGTLHFYSNDLLNDHQVTAQLGYNYVLSRRSEIALIGGYQDFSIGGYSSALQTQFANVVYKRQVSRRLSLVAGAGPLASDFGKVFSMPGRQWSYMALATVGYDLRGTALAFNYLDYENNGSGYLLGARTRRFTASAEHEFSRNWQGLLDVGYARSTALEQVTVPLFNLGSRRSFDAEYVNLQLSHRLTPHFKVFATYVFSNEQFDASTTCLTVTCGLGTRRQMGGIGLSWNPEPIVIH